ncbi:alginate lyase family protein [Candidatus Poribacteria bacterium]
MDLASSTQFTKEVDPEDMSVQHYLRQLIKYRPHIIVYRILRKTAFRLKVEVESLKANLFSTHISDEQLLESLIDSYESVDELFRHLEERKQPNFFFQPSSKSRMIDVVKSHYPNTINQAIADADKIREHVFNLLGSGDVYLGEKIDWHTDFKTNWRWNPGYYKKLDCQDLDNPYDVKVPWELSRCQHFITLGKTYWYIGDEKYAEEFVAQINDWIESNPPKFGVNWVCTMDVAIRAVNWIWGYYFFKDSPNLTEEFMAEFLRSLLAHGRHIMGNLELGNPTGNHYLSDLVGLIYIGVMFPEFKEARKWREFGLSGLIKEMGKEVYPDGADYEASTSYHRLVTELFLSAAVLCLRNCSMFQNRSKKRKSTPEFSPFPDWYMQRLKKMIEFVGYYTKPDGTSPQIGDNDNGRLHILSDYGNWRILDHTYLLSMGAILFANAEFKKRVGKLHEEAFWLFGVDGVQKFSAISKSNTKLSSKGFVDIGIYIMRHQDTYAIVDCIANNPEAPAGHLHNSRLSFELYMLGGTAIIDPGTYVYTADVAWRNRFRSTAYHNVITVDSHEQDIIEPYSPFRVERMATVKVNHWETTEQYDLLDAEHNGYSEISVIHRRQFLFDKEEKSYMIRDSLSGSGIHKVEAYFHIDSSVQAYPHREMPNVALCRLPDGDLALIPVPLGNFELSMEQSWVSHSYGTKAPNITLRYAATRQLPATFLFLLCPLSSDDDVCQKIEYAHKNEEFLIGKCDGVSK